MKKLEGTLLPPQKHKNVPVNAQWLSGQGEGTWFSITKEDNLLEFEYRVRRISPQGNIDCDKKFELDAKNLSFDISKDWKIAHISHCAEVRVLQDNVLYLLNFIKEFN